jgi:hypothetical protein
MVLSVSMLLLLLSPAVIDRPIRRGFHKSPGGS